MTARVPTRTRAALLGAGLVLLALPIGGGAARAATTIDNSYTNYAFPDISGGEPSIGVDTETGAAMVQFMLTTMRVTWDDTTSPPTMSFEDVSPFTNIDTLDPLLFTDRHTGRTFTSQLLLACSLMSYSDDAGETWTPSEGCGPGALVDHQTVGGGPVHAPLTGLVYDGIVYYCAQDGFNGQCATSLDGGATFGAGVPIVNTPANNPGDPEGGACTAIHGHLKVDLDGTAYVPLKGCGGQLTLENLTNTEYWGGTPSVSVSENNGLTWTIRKIPGGHNQDESDPSLGIGRGDKVSGGRLFMGWQDGTNPSALLYGTESVPKVAYSDDHGMTWSEPYDVSAGLGIRNVQFPEVVVGDDDRAAFAWLGTDAVGDDQHLGFVGPDGKPAVWHMYMSRTYDGGKTWTTVDTTSTDPVQRGCVFLLGTSNKTATDDALCDQRNMLDFNDMAMDNDGRPLLAYADGCNADCVKAPDDPSHAADGYVLRQSTGRGLLAEFDAKLGAVGAGNPPAGSGGTGGTGGGNPRPGSGGTTPSTGLPGWLAVAGGLLLTAGALTGRRRRTA